MKKSLIVLSAMLCFSYFARAQSPQSLYVFTASASGAYPTSSNLQIPANIDSLNVRITGIATTQSWSAQIQTSPDGVTWTSCGSLVTVTAASSSSGGGCTPSGALYMRVSITAGTGGGTLYGALMGTCSLCQLSSSGGGDGGGGDTITTPNGTLSVGGSSSNTSVDVLKVPTTNTSANSAFYCLLSSVSTTSAGQAPYVSPNCSFNPSTGKLAIGTAGSATGTLTLESSTATGGVTLSPASAASQFTATVPAATDTIAELAQAQTLTNKTISGSANTLSNIGNSSLTNSAITIAGTSVALGGSISSFPSPGAIGGTTAAAGSFTTLTGTTFNTTTKCAGVGTSASPSVVSCSAAAAGLFSCATNASGATCVVDTTAVTASSVIQIQPDSSVGSALSVTCNTTADSGLTAPRVSARSAGTSFTITLGTYTTNPECFSYLVVN